jgi:RNA polymerase sigma factor for flagellar operon FliA
MNVASTFPQLLQSPSPPTATSPILTGPVPCARISSGPDATPRPTLLPQARAERMLKTVRRLAAGFARCRPPHFDLDGLVGAGALGLAEAFSRRNGMPGGEFEAFALPRIRGAMLDELRRGDVMSRVGRARTKTINRAVRAVERRLGVQAGAADVAAELGIRPSEYHQLCASVATQREPMSLSATTHGDETGGRDIPDSTHAPDEALLHENMAEVAAARMATLPTRTRRILIAIHVEGKTLKQVGVELGVSESRVSQIRTAAVASLRASIRRDDQARRS